VRLNLPGLEPSGDINPNALAVAALIVTPLGAAILFLKPRDRVDWLTLWPLGLVVSLFGTFILGVTRSRSAWIAIWVTLALLLVSGLRSAAWRVAVGALVIGLPLAAAAAVPLSSKDDFLAQAGRVWTTTHDRAHVTASGVDRWKESPWLGIGMNQFRHVYQPPPGTAYYDVVHAHNVFVQTALDVGAIGLAAYCGVLGFLLMRARQIALGPASLWRNAAAGAALSLVAATLFGLSDAVALGAKASLFQWLAAGLILSAWGMQQAATGSHAT